MDHHLFQHVNVEPRNTHLPNGLAKDLDEECRRYEALIQRLAGLTSTARHRQSGAHRLQRTALGAAISNARQGVDAYNDQTEC